MPMKEWFHLTFPLLVIEQITFCWAEQRFSEVLSATSWWWTGRPGVLRFMGSQRIERDWATELNWTELNAVLSWTLVNRQAKVNHYFKNLSRTVRMDIQYSRKTGGEIERWEQASKHAKFYWLEKWMFVVGAQVPQVGFLHHLIFPHVYKFHFTCDFFSQYKQH